MALLEFSLFTRHSVDFNSICSSPGMPVLIGSNPEDRSGQLESALTERGVKVVRIGAGEDRNVIIVEDDSSTLTLSLRDRDGINGFVRGLGSYFSIDITGMDTNILAPLTRAAWDCAGEFDAIYIEPESYARSQTPTEGELFDLSERIEGIGPIPGFSRIRPDDGEAWILVPLLGFEGARLAHLVENIEPLDGAIYPVVGVPGFQMEYPFNTYLGNKNVLVATRAWMNARYSKANCPFSLFYCLEKLKRSRPNAHMRIAPIGTKPHGLGAVIYSLSHPENTELVYDFPIKAPRRTSGVSKVSVFEISEFRDFLHMDPDGVSLQVGATN